jgi:hypothetical protein
VFYSVSGQIGVGLRVPLFQDAFPASANSNRKSNDSTARSAILKMKAQAQITELGIQRNVKDLRSRTYNLAISKPYLAGFKILAPNDKCRKKRN